MKTTSHETLPTAASAGKAARLDPVDHVDLAEAGATERRHLARAALKSRHASGLSRLMEERDDLRGVHALADFVDESLRWTA